jgi:TfoX C-terminal domain/Probable zinc-ribbon domain
MKSNKQRRAEIKARRVQRAAEHLASPSDAVPRPMPTGTAPCNPELLAPYNSYGTPSFVAHGFYSDALFKCKYCGKEEIWRATQQKWWYEVAKGSVESGASRCSSCRRIERERRAQARRVHLEGVETKHGSKTLSSLAGLGPKSEAMLVRAGITSVEQLRQLGSVRAFVMVKEAGLGPSINLLWALEGGLSGQHWQQVAREHRTSLLLALEQLERSRQ